jgi:hypothetical protein
MQKGWVYEPAITNYEAMLFFNSIKSHNDPYYYCPIAIAKRSEIGMKYRFLCIAVNKMNPGTPSHFADIEVYKPQEGRPYATCIYRIEFENIIPQRMP